MRLIDADKLKEAIMMKEDVSEETWDELYDSVLDEIDNAPVVEITEEMAIDKLHETGWMQAHDKAMTETPYGCYASIQRAYKEGKDRGIKIAYSDYDFD